MTEEEIWLDISGYRGEYKVSSLGRVRVLAREVSRLGRDGNHHKVSRPEKVITPKKRGQYLYVALWLDGKREAVSVHRLVCQEFHGAPPNDWEVNHINEDKYDNKASNLEWLSRKDNQLHSKGPRLTACQGGCFLYAIGVKEMAKLIGISKASVQRLLRKEYESVKGWEVFYRTIN